MTTITPPIIANIAGPLWSERPIVLKKLLPDFLVKRMVFTVACTRLVLGDADFCVDLTNESSNCVVIASAIVESVALVTLVVVLVFVVVVVVLTVVVVVVVAAFVVKTTHTHQQAQMKLTNE